MHFGIHNRENSRRIFSRFFLVLAGLAVWSSDMLAQVPFSTNKEHRLEESNALQGLLADGTPLTKEKLEALLAAHGTWLEKSGNRITEELAKRNVSLEELLASDWGADEGRLVLGRATLKGADLLGANLAGANLQKTTLIGANLQGANLAGANLQTTLVGANMQGAILGGAYLQGAHLSEANLQGAFLVEANLKGTWLRQANLRGANLTGTNLEGAVLWEANMQSVLYETKPRALPDSVSLRSAHSLETMWFENSPHALEELRQAFKTAGMRQQERQITYAIKRSEWRNARKKGAVIEPVFNYVFFDLTVRYGLEPGRALWVIGIFILLFAMPYTYAFAATKKKDGIWRVWPEDRPRPEIGTETPELITVSGWRVYTHALYFSLLSAFHIGWRDLNLGHWIARLQLRSYALRPSGWVRTASGIQSLISVYLLAMWVLTYFGRPFE